MSNDENEERKGSCQPCCTCYSAIAFFIWVLVGLLQALNDNVTCIQPLIPIVITYLVFHVISIFNAMWEMYRPMFTPRFRRRMKYVSAFVRLVTYLWTFIAWGLLLGFFITDQAIRDCTYEKAYTLHTFLWTGFVLASIVVVLWIPVLLLYSCLICCYCCTGQFASDVAEQRHYRETANQRAEEIAHPRRAKIKQFESFLGVDHDIPNECMICLEEFDGDDPLRKLPCGHYFHQQCIGKWWKDSPRNHGRCAYCNQNENQATDLHKEAYQAAAV